MTTQTAYLVSIQSLIPLKNTEKKAVMFSIASLKVPSRQIIYLIQCQLDSQLASFQIWWVQLSQKYHD
jgi:hypothetical protein